MLLRSAAQGADSVRSPTTKAPQELDINFLILNDGKELRGTLQNTGGAVQYDLIRMGSLKKTGKVLEIQAALKREDLNARIA